MHKFHATSAYTEMERFETAEEFRAWVEKNRPLGGEDYHWSRAPSEYESGYDEWRDSMELLPLDVPRSYPAILIHEKVITLAASTILGYVYPSDFTK
jgi:hypothetical protein